MTSRHTRVALCALVVAVAVAGGTASASPAGDRQLQSVDVVLLPVEPTAIALYADSRGFFREQGLDVKLEFLKDPTLLGSSVIGGVADFASVHVGASILQEAAGAPTKVIASGAMYDRTKVKTSALVAMPSKRIRRAQDLVGKRVAIDKKLTIAHVGLVKWLKRGGVSENRVSLLELPFPDMVGVLTRGDAAAAVLPEPWLTQVLRRGARIVTPPIDAVCATQCLNTVWIARRSVDPALAARFRAALQKAAVWANQPRNAEASAKILARRLELPLGLTRVIRRTTFATRLRPGFAQQWVDAYAELGLIPKTFPAGDLVK
jgi:NitT/TauT family transport system substrate-binding protein